MKSYFGEVPYCKRDMKYFEEKFTNDFDLRVDIEHGDNLDIKSVLDVFQVAVWKCIKK